MTAEDYIKAEWCLMAWRAGKGYGANAMVAILYVIRNVRDAESHQFMMINETRRPDVRDPEFLQLLQAVDAIYDGKVDKLTGGATLFGRGLGYERCATVGGLDFYK